MKGEFGRRNALPLLVALGVGVTLPAFLAMVRSAGYQIPQPQIELDYVMGLCWALLLGASIAFWPVPDEDKTTLIGLWAARTVMTLGVMLAYEWYYGLDAFWYFGQSLLTGPPIEGMGVGSGTGNMLAFSRLHSALLPSYHATKVTFSLVGLISIYLIYRGCVRVLGKPNRKLLILLGLYPSLLFWSSILGKEPVQLLGVALYAYGVMSLWATNRSAFSVPIILGIALSTFMRLWYGLILLIPLIVFLFRGIRGIPARIVFVVSSLFALNWAVDIFKARFGVMALADLAAEAQRLAVNWENGAAQTGQVLFPDVGSMIRFAPLGAFTALFRPLPGEVLNPFGVLAGVENAILLTLVAMAAFRGRVKRFSEPLVQWGLVFIITWASLYAFVSYYNAGAAVRFRLPILPVLLCLLLYLSRPLEQDGGTGLRREKVS